MAKSKNRIQFLINEYLETHGAIDLLLPDGVSLEIGITQEGKHGTERHSDYCWVVANRDNRTTVFDRYAMSMRFAGGRNRLVDQADEGIVTIL